MNIDEIRADLADEQAALDDVVATLAPGDWRRPTPAPGWTVADQLAHLTYFDRAAVTAITDPDGFTRMVDELVARLDGGGAAVDESTLAPYRDLSPSELLAAWRGGRDQLDRAARTLGARTRVPWYGPSMSARSFLTARLMETWAHGQDVCDAVGVERPATGRLRHIARLGVITRSWSYVNRGLEPPAADVRVELTAPSGAVWTFGPEQADESVTGPALDFCLVVTQRRHLDDTHLQTTPLARDWLERAQAFAGPPTDPPAPGSRR